MKTTVITSIDRLAYKINLIKSKQNLNSEELLLVRRLVKVLEDHEVENGFIL